MDYSDRLEMSIRKTLDAHERFSLNDLACLKEAVVIASERDSKFKDLSYKIDHLIRKYGG